MTSSDGYRELTATGRWAALMIAAGLLAAGAVLLFSLVFFRVDRPVPWPPGSGSIYAVAFGTAGTCALFGIYALVYIAISVVAAFRGKESWKALAQRVVFTIVGIALVAMSVSVSLRVFYWPWARASAVETVLSNPAKWRLVECARTLCDHWDDETARALRDGFRSAPRGAAQSAVAYALAAGGDATYLRRLAESAGDLAAGAVTSEDTGVSSRGDVVWLLGTIVEKDAVKLDSSGPDLLDAIAGLHWDGREKRYRLVEPRDDRFDGLY